jgi:hypothetical protein
VSPSLGGDWFDATDLLAITVRIVGSIITD